MVLLYYSTDPIKSLSMAKQQLIEIKDTLKNISPAYADAVAFLGATPQRIQTQVSMHGLRLKACTLTTQL